MRSHEYRLFPPEKADLFPENQNDSDKSDQWVEAGITVRALFL
jgi:hypothetical protein